MEISTKETNEIQQEMGDGMKKEKEKKKREIPGRSKQISEERTQGDQARCKWNKREDI